MAHRWKLLLVTAAMTPGLAACGTSTSGNPPPSTSASSVTLFDPCTQIPDDVLRAMGVDPATKDVGVAGVHQSGWEICGWKGSKYAITVYSTRRAVSEFEQKTGNVDFRDVTIGGRQGRQFRVEGASKDLLCDVIFPAEQGVLQLELSNRASLSNHEDPCILLSRVGIEIVPVLPQ